MRIKFINKLIDKIYGIYIIIYVIIIIFSNLKNLVNKGKIK